MNLFENCLLACDVDETLMNNGVIPKRNLEQINRFLNAGGYFSLATGRTVAAVSPVLAQLGKRVTSVLANGSMIYDFENKKVVAQWVLEKEEHMVARKVMQANLQVGIEVHSEDHIFILEDHEEVRAHEDYEKYRAEIMPFDEVDRFGWNKVLYLFGDEQEREKGKRIIHALHPTSAFSDTSAVIRNKKRYYYEQFPCGISKATGVARLAEILHIRPGGLFVMGDYYNDLSMMEKADISAAPSGAPEDIRRAADFVACPCSDGAVADFIEYLFKTRKD